MKDFFEVTCETDNEQEALVATAKHLKEILQTMSDEEIAEHIKRSVVNRKGGWHFEIELHFATEFFMTDRELYFLKGEIIGEQLKRGVMTLNEARSEFGLPPIPHGDVLGIAESYINEMEYDRKRLVPSNTEDRSATGA